MERLKQQMNFLTEIDKVKDVFRQSLVVNGKRNENDAEHSWHMCMVAIILKEYFIKELDLEKSLKLMLIHDLVEIYAGDTPAFGVERLDKYEAELRAAKTVFSLLPEEQAKEYLDFWLEFEECQTNEAIYANICDRFQGSMQNFTSNGYTWRKFNPSSSKVLERLELVKKYTPVLYEECLYPEIKKYIDKGIIKNS